MSQLDWARITDGATFEALIGAMVVHRQPDAHPLGKPGPDGAIDTVDDTTSTVYQAKYRRSWTPSQLADEAQKEFTKISAYRKPGHHRHALWRDITTWVMATNAEGGATALARWKSEVVPAFAALGIDAVWWSRDRLEADLLDDMPGLRRSFFGGERRFFLTLREIWPMLAERDPIEAPDWSQPPAGSATHRDDFTGFVDDPDARYCIIAGPGGTGKTRLLWQFGRDTIGKTNDRLDVWWVDPDRLGATVAWYEHVVPTRPALLLLDEPDVGALRQIELEAATRANWKVALVVRSEQEAVSRWFEERRGKSGRAPLRITLRALPDDVAEQAAAQLAGVDPDDPTARHIARAADGYPGWMAIVVRLRAGGGDLPDPDAVARAYVDSVVDNLTPEPAEAQRLREVLRWLALMQPLNVEAPTEAEWLADQCGFEQPFLALDAIERLSEAGLVLARGRLRAIKPDLIRDWLLRAWLIDDSRPGARSHAGDAALAHVLGAPGLDRLLRNVSRVELACRMADPPVEADLLGEFDRLLLNATQTVSALEQLTALRLAGSVRASRPALVRKVVRSLRTRPGPPSQAEHPLMGRRTVRARDVLRALPWALFEAAGYVIERREQRQFLAEMIALVEQEADIPEDPRGMNAPWGGGKRPSELLPRMIDREMHFLSDFLEPAFAEAQQRITALEGPQPVSPAESLTLTTLLDPLLAVEYVRSGTEGDKWVMVRGVRPPRHAFWARWRTLHEGLWNVTMAAEAASENRQLAWRLLDRTHGNVLQAADGDAGLTEMLRDDLTRAAARMDDARTTSRERVVARALWRWHLTYGEDDQRALAEKCERALWQDPALKPYQTMVTAGYREIGEAAQRVADWLVDDAPDGQAITDWFETAIELFGDETAKHWTPAVAYRMGSHWRPELLDAARRLARAEGWRPHLGARMYWQRLRAQRDSGALDEARGELEAILSAAGSDERRRAILTDLYAHWEATQQATATELGWFERWTPWFQGPAMGLLLQILGYLWRVDPARFFTLANGIWRTIDDRHRGDALTALMESLTYGKERPVEAANERRMAEWLLDRLLEVPDLDRFYVGSTRHRGQLEHRAARLLKPTLGCMPIAHLVDRLASRAETARRLAGKPQVPPDAPENGDSGPPAETGSPWQTLGHSFDLGVLIDQSTWSTEAAQRLVALFCEREIDASMLMSAPRQCGALDPDGRWLPDAIIEQIAAVPTTSALTDIFYPARLAKGWTEGSEAWRPIARAVCVWADAQDDEKARRGAWAELYDGSTGVVMGRDGILRRYHARRDALKHTLEVEQDPLLHDYWSWRVEVLRKMVRSETERLDEEELA